MKPGIRLKQSTSLLHTHFTQLRITAYGNYPLDAVARKEQWEKWGIEQNAWFAFYHDPFMRACKFDEKRNERYFTGTF